MSQRMPFKKMESSFLTSSPTTTANSTTSMTNTTSTNTQTPVRPHQPPSTPVEINDITLHIKIKYECEKVRTFIADLSKSNSDMTVNGRTLSVLQLYTLYTLNVPVDMSNRSARKVHRPTLYIQRNDEFGPFKYYYLLNLFDIEYTIDGEFPTLWKTTFNTNVTVKPPETNSTESDQATSTSNVNNAATLLDVFKIICREQKYDESHATVWQDSFNGM
jgi:hypothetical protein